MQVVGRKGSLSSAADRSTQTTRAFPASSTATSCACEVNPGLVSVWVKLRAPAALSLRVSVSDVVGVSWRQTIVALPAGSTATSG